MTYTISRVLVLTASKVEIRLLHFQLNPCLIKKQEKGNGSLSWQEKKKRTIIISVAPQIKGKLMIMMMQILKIIFIMKAKMKKFLRITRLHFNFVYFFGNWTNFFWLGFQNIVESNYNEKIWLSRCIPRYFECLVTSRSRLQLVCWAWSLLWGISTMAALSCLYQSRQLSECECLSISRCGHDHAFFYVGVPDNSHMEESMIMTLLIHLLFIWSLVLVDEWI